MICLWWRKYRFITRVWLQFKGGGLREKSSEALFPVVNQSETSSCRLWLVQERRRCDRLMHQTQRTVAWVLLSSFSSLLPFLPSGQFDLVSLPFIFTPPLHPHDLNANKRWQILNTFLISTRQTLVTQINSKFSSVLTMLRKSHQLNLLSESLPADIFCLVASSSPQRSRGKFTGEMNWHLILFKKHPERVSDFDVGDKWAMSGSVKDSRGEEASSWNRGERRCCRCFQTQLESYLYHQDLFQPDSLKAEHYNPHEGRLYCKAVVLL